MAHRVVLDTNVLVSALVFNSRRWAWLRHAWQQNDIIPLVCSETARELLRVLTYPKFKLSKAERDQLLSDYLPFADVVELPTPCPDLPLCRDVHDQQFLVLAKVGRARFLVTGDVGLLVMRDSYPELIIRPEEVNHLLTQS